MCQYKIGRRTKVVTRRKFASFVQPEPQPIFSLEEEDEKETLEHFKHMIKICPNIGHYFPE